jgi:hypothetical protein
MHKRSHDILADINIDFIDTSHSHCQGGGDGSPGGPNRAKEQYDTLKHEQEEALGPTDISTVATVHRLAQTLEQLGAEHPGNKEKAQTLYRGVYILYQSIFG